MSEAQNINIQQRIIGAIVLVSLGIIVIPLVLNGGRTVDNNDFLEQPIADNNIPDMPKSFNRVLPVIPKPVAMPAAKTVSAYPERVTTTTTAKKDEKTTQKPEKTPQIEYLKVSRPTSTEIKLAYTLQIASFSQKSNANALQSKLRKKKYKAYIESTMTADGKIYRLRVGPYLKFKQISTVKKQLEKQFKLGNTIILKY